MPTADPQITLLPLMRRFWISLVSIWIWTVLGVCLLVWFPLLVILRLVTAPFDPGRYWVGFFFRKVAVVMTALNPLWDFKVSGTLPPDPRRPYVVVANHESFVDILLISHLPWEMKWFSKVELMRIPIMGWDMWLAGDIPILRGTRKSAVEAMRRCRTILGQRVSVILFPEGTRSVDGQLLPFKDGAFRLAIDSGVPILPLVVCGTGTALRKHDWRVNPARAEVRVLEPIETTGLTPATVPVLRDRVRDLIAKTRAELGPAIQPPIPT